MSVRQLPTFVPRTAVVALDLGHMWRYLVCGQYKGCTVFRTVDGQVQVGKMSGLVHSPRITLDRLIEVRRNGQRELWDLGTGIWVCE